MVIPILSSRFPRTPQPPSIGEGGHFSGSAFIVVLRGLFLGAIWALVPCRDVPGTQQDAVWVWDMSSGSCWSFSPKFANVSQPVGATSQIGIVFLSTYLQLHFIELASGFGERALMC